MNSRNSESACPLGELAVGLALHALEPAEEALVAAHLAECAECARTVAETERVGAALGLSVPEETPSAALEQRVLAIAKGGGAPVSVIPLDRATQTQRNTRMARPTGRMLVAAAAVVLAAASVALGIRVVQLDGQRDQAVRQVTEMSEAMQRAANPAFVRVPLVAGDGRPMGMVLAARDSVAVVSTALPDNRVQDQIYILWGLDHGKPQALTGFDVAPGGPVQHVVPSVPHARSFTGYAVSLEAGRSAPAEPTTVMAQGTVES